MSIAVRNKNSAVRGTARCPAPPAAQHTYVGELRLYPDWQLILGEPQSSGRLAAVRVHQQIGLGADKVVELHQEPRELRNTKQHQIV